MAYSTNLESTIKRFGVTQVSTPSNKHTVDIVFVHGLNGHPYHTWRSKEKQVFWPAQLLPSALEKENARILVYGYDADIASFADGASKDKIHNHAEQLIAALWANRQTHNAIEHPIVFVGHSLGGLIIKRALIYSSGISGHRTNHLRSVYISTYGIVFLGTPHLGIDVSQWGSQIQNIFGTTLPTTSIGDQPYLIDALKTNNETLQNIDRHFAQLTNRFHVFYFHEGKPTKIEGVERYVVNEESASPNTPDVERATIQQTHARMCQFESKSAPGFDLLTEAIDRYATEASETIRSRWIYEKDERRTRTRAQVEELLAGTIVSISQDSDDLGDQAIDNTRSSTLIASHTNASTTQQLKRYYVVERQRVKDFVGRRAQLQQISSHFSGVSPQQPNVLILHALGGQGKSQIALEYCQCWREHYRGIFWINASSEALALQSYIQIATELNLSSSTKLRDGEKAVRLVKDSLEYWSEDWLLVFDNYDDPSDFKVQRLLPRSKTGHVIVTSRRRDLNRLGSLMEVPPMAEEDGVGLLLREYTNEDIQEHFDIACKIVQRLGGLALAIDQAAAYIRYQRMTLDHLGEFMTMYDLQRKQILSYTPEPFWEYCTAQIHGEEDRAQAISAFTTWEMSLEQLNSEKSIDRNEVTRFLTVAAFFNPVRIEEWLFRNRWENDQTQWLYALGVIDDNPNSEDDSEDDYDNSNHNDPSRNLRPYMSTRKNRAQTTSQSKRRKLSKNDSENSKVKYSSNHISDGEWDSKQFWYILDKLERLSLVQDVKSNDQRSSFSLHPLIRDFLQLRKQARSRQFYISESLEIVASSARIYDKFVLTGPEQGTALLAHVDACISNDERLSKPQHRIGNKIATCHIAEDLVLFYERLDQYEASSRLNLRILETRKETLGESHRDTLHSMHKQAQLLGWNKSHCEASAILRRLLQLAEKVLGKDDSLTLRSMIDLAELLNAEGAHDQAEGLARQTLEKHQKVLGKSNIETINCMHILANIGFSQKNDVEAEKLLLQASQLVQKVDNVDDSRTLFIMHDLALRLQELYKYEDAEAILNHTSQLRKQVLGLEHPDTLDNMKWHGIVLGDQEKYNEAEKIIRLTVQLSQKMLGKENPTTLDNIDWLGMMLRHQGKYNEAEKVLSETLQLRQRVMGSEHCDTLNTMHSLALALSDQKDKQAKAEDMIRQTLGLMQKELGREDRYTLEIMDSLARVLKDQSKFDEAEDISRQTLQLSQKALGNDHPDTLRSVELLDMVLSEQSKYDEAQHMSGKLLRINENVSGNEHPDTLWCMNSNAGTLGDQRNKQNKAKEMFCQILQLKQKSLGCEQPDTLKQTKHSLASTLSDQDEKKLREAEEVFRQTLRLAHEILGKEHSYTLNSMCWLAKLLHTQRKYSEAAEMLLENLCLTQSVSGSERSYTSMIMRQLSDLLRDEGNSDEAEKMFRQTLQSSQKILGKEHSMTLDIMTSLALVLREQAKFDEVEEICCQILQISQKAFGEEHSYTFNILELLATVFFEQGKHDKAEEMFRAALRVKQQVLGKEHPMTLLSMRVLAGLLSEQTKYDEAQEMLKQALQSSQKASGKEHPDTLQCMRLLGSVLRIQGKHDEANEMDRDRLEIKRRQGT